MLIEIEHGIRNFAFCQMDCSHNFILDFDFSTRTELELSAEKEEEVMVDNSSPAEQVCRKGQDMTFNVNLKSNQLQKPTVQWMFNGQQIKTSERVSHSLVRLPE